MRSRIFTALSALVLGLATLPADLPAEDVKLSVVPVAGQVSMIIGQGGNIGLLNGPDGTFLIDDQFAPLTEQILAAIRSVGGTTPRFLINTHYHGDHTGGNENLGRQGALIVSHDNVRERLLSGSYIAAFKMKSPPLSESGLPVVTFSSDLSFHLNGDTVKVMHAPHAHTDGDSFIHFRAANVIHAGDIFFNGFYPFIDVAHGGSVKGMIAAVDRILALSDAQTRIIPGHGPLADRADLVAYRQMLAVTYERLKQLKSEGRSAAEAVAAKPLADLEETWGDGMFSGDRWIELTYPGVY